MIMKISPTIVILIAVLLSVASAVVVSLLKYDEFFREEAEIPAEFTSLEFDADDNQPLEEVEGDHQSLSQEHTERRMQEIIDEEKSGD